MADRILRRPNRSSASILAMAACAFAAVSSTAFAQASLTYHPASLRVYGASADGSTVYGTESTPTGVQAFVLKNGTKTYVIQAGGPDEIREDAQRVVAGSHQSVAITRDSEWERAAAAGLA
ncbi:MAG TPA: hypothetical protein VNC50_07380, partial [Planctomycetia bacterium]|nr:hypothetical protein [Planctomycetia bacterium]